MPHAAGTAPGPISLIDAARATPATAPEFVDCLANHGGRPALIAGDRTVSYAALSDAVDIAVDRFGPGRRLVAIPAANTIDCVVAYLAALRGGHVVAMLPQCRADDIAAHYRPDTILTDAGLLDLRDSAEHDLHRDLSLLLSTSGSTGSPKLVRLSNANLSSNAYAVAESLELGESDRGITSLSLSYSYGLSVLHSHLARGAGIVLTSASLTAPEFWDQVRDHKVTSLACRALLLRSPRPGRLRGVRHPVPSPDHVCRRPARARHGCPLRAAGRPAELGPGPHVRADRGDARMAYLPEHLVEQHPASVGRPVAGGRVRLDDIDADGVGELVYEGPNVMLGYAVDPEDLARGRDVTELRTGDLARITDDGLIEIRGRTSRIAKVRGLRVALGDVDRALEAEGVIASAVALDDTLGAAVVGADPSLCRRIIERVTGLPASVVHVVAVESLPRLETGKVDDRAVRALVEAAVVGVLVDADAGAMAVEERLRRCYARLLGKAVGPDDSFASSGGDSLSYVEVSLAVEELLGTLPSRWERLTIAELAAAEPKPPRRWTGRQLDSTVALRAAAIVLVRRLACAGLRHPRRAHVLMALIGFNIARFQMTESDPKRRMRLMWRSTAWSCCRRWPSWPSLRRSPTPTDGRSSASTGSLPRSR